MKTKTKGETGAAKTLCSPFDQPELPQGIITESQRLYPTLLSSGIYWVFFVLFLLLQIVVFLKMKQNYTQ